MRWVEKLFYKEEERLKKYDRNSEKRQKRENFISKCNSFPGEPSRLGIGSLFKIYKTIFDIPGIQTKIFFL